MVQSIQEKNITHFVNTFSENEVRVMNKLKNITMKNSKSKCQREGNCIDHQMFNNALITTLRLAKDSTKVVDTNVEESNDHARKSNLSEDWEHENLQKRQVVMDDEVEVDDMTFSVKERKDGYKRTRADDNPYAVLVFVSIRHKKKRGRYVPELW